MDNPTISEYLETLNGRLMESTYLEDRISALEKIRKFVEKEPNQVGIHCLSAIVQSMKHFVHKFHFDILKCILHSFNGKEFAEILMKNENHIKIIINARNRRSTDLLLIFSHFNSSVISTIFLKNRNLINYFNKLDENILSLIKIIIENEELRQLLVNNGLIERIFKSLNDKKIIKQSFSVLEKILENSFYCQNYFFKNNLESFFEYESISHFYFYNVIDKFLDLKNENFSIFQKEFYDKKLVDIAFQSSRFDYIYKYYYNRQGLAENFKNFDFYTAFLNIEKKKELIEIFYQINSNFVIIPDWSKDATFYFLCSYFFKKYYLMNENDSVHIKNDTKIAEIVNISNQNNLNSQSLLNMKIEFKPQNEMNAQNNFYRSKDSNIRSNSPTINNLHPQNSLNLQNDQNIEELPEEMLFYQDTEYSDNFLNQISNLEISDENQEQKIIQHCTQNLIDILNVSEMRQIGILLILVILKNQINLKEDLQILKTTVLFNIQVSLTVQGLLLLIDEFIDIREEYCIECLIETKKCLLQNKLVHNKLLIFIENQINDKLKILYEKIQKRELAKIEIKEDNFTEKHSETETVNFQQSPTDVLRTFVTNMSSKFNKQKDEKKEDDSAFDL